MAQKSKVPYAQPLNPVTRVLAALGDHKIAAWLLLKNVRGEDDSIQCSAHAVIIWFIPRLTSSIYIFIYLLYLALLLYHSHLEWSSDVNHLVNGGVVEVQ